MGFGLTILITGATGLVGKALVQYLLNKPMVAKNPNKLRLLVREKEGDPYRQKFLMMCESKGIDIFIGNLKSKKDLLSFTKVSDNTKSILIHCGAIFNFWQPYDLLYNVNVKGTERILESFHKNNLKKLVYLSSIAVYGNIRGENDRGVTEDHPIDLKLRKNYELTKALAEEKIRKYQQNNPQKIITIIRPCGIVGGSGQTIDIFSRMIFGRFVPLPRGGKDKMSLVDVNDVVRAIDFLSSFNFGNYNIFNLVSYTPTLREVILELGQALQRKKLTILPIPLIFFKPLYYFSRILRKFKKPNENSLLLPILFDKLGQDVWVDDSKIREIGFSARASLRESMIHFGSFIANSPNYAEKKFSIAI